METSKHLRTLERTGDSSQGGVPQNGKMPGSQQAEEGTWDELEGYL